MAAVTFATCADLPDGDEDAPGLGRALTDLGVEPRWQVWNDPAAVWTPGLVVVRSTWDYTQSPQRFLDWSRSVPLLANPAEVIAWNSDKVYLLELERAGIPIVPTAAVRPGDGLPAASAAEFVVKPSVGAGSRGAGRFAGDDVAGAAEHVDRLHADGLTALVQPYLADVDELGETALIYFAGEFSHAIGKGAMLPAGTVHPARSHALYVEERIEARTPSTEELAVGSTVLAMVRERFGTDLLYTRVDLLPGPDGPLLGELELIEPSLFLNHAPGAAQRFAAAIAARL